LPQEDWRLGSPVFSSFNNKIELVGMINSLGNPPNSLCSVTSAQVLMGLLEESDTP
jgi:hypothetical protein